jgi:peroxiredoxin
MAGSMKSALLLQVGFTIVAAIGVYSFVTSARDGERRRVCTPVCALRPDYANNSRLAPDFELPGLDGKNVKLSDFRGKVVILNFWTKTCKPCLEEMPSLADLGQVLQADPRIQLITVSTDDSLEDVRHTLQALLQREPPFLTLVDADNTIVSEKYGTKLYPETWFVDPKGVIRARFDGPRDWTSPLQLEFAQSLLEPVKCAVEFEQKQVTGPLAGLCEEIPRAAM